MSDTAIDLQQVIDACFPVRSGLGVLADLVSDRISELYPEEYGVVESALERRQHEFATGRVLARHCMAELGLTPGPVFRGAKREPIWPAGMTGSITHSANHAVAAIARLETARSLGIDLEDVARVGGRMHDKLFRPAEQKLIEGGDPRLPGILFSAKEAGYKATFPLVGRYIGFQEAEVEVDWTERRFRLRYVGDHFPNRVMERGQGYFLFCEPYVLSLVIIPAGK